jgi:hypothetical protein
MEWPRNAQSGLLQQHCGGMRSWSVVASSEQSILSECSEDSEVHVVKGGGRDTIIGRGAVSEAWKWWVVERWGRLGPLMAIVRDDNDRRGWRWLSP